MGLPFLHGVTRLPTPGLAYGDYPQRAASHHGQALRALLRGLASHLHGPLPWRRTPQLPPAVHRAYTTALHGLGSVAVLESAAAQVRARLRRDGLSPKACGQALAVAAMAMQRTQGLMPYDTQVLAAWLMLQGRLVEMATGEGKTVAAALAAAVAGLAGTPVHVLTANEYLVQRDQQTLAPTFAALGLRSAAITAALAGAPRHAAWRADVVYTTASQLAFDYLRDHLALGGERDARVLRAQAMEDDAQAPIPAAAIAALNAAAKAAVNAATGAAASTEKSAAASAEISAEIGAHANGSESGRASFSATGRTDGSADGSTDASTDASANTRAKPNPSTPTGPLLPGLCLCLLDEADSILLDEAVVPLILAAPAGQLDTAAYQRAFELSRSLQRQLHYTLETPQHRATLTPAGRARINAAVAGASGDLHPARRACELVEAALAARLLYRRDREYAVLSTAAPQPGNAPASAATAGLAAPANASAELQLIDELTGRIATGRQWQGALHPMVQIKEGLPPSPPTRTAAQMTYQRFFPRYLHLAGMSGTLLEAQHELHQLYGCPVQRLPLAQPARRRWLGQRCYATAADKWQAVVQTVQQQRALGRPVLVGTDSVADSARVAALLQAAGVPHQLLNATQDSAEAAQVARAGFAGCVTVATNMAGRGTDIRLDEAATAAGGLHVVATMRNRARRIDRQLTGRAARHGDPGSAELLLALDDSLLQRTLPAPLLAAAQGLARWLPAGAGPLQSAPRSARTSAPSSERPAKPSKQHTTRRPTQQPAGAPRACRASRTGKRLVFHRPTRGRVARPQPPP